MWTTCTLILQVELAKLLVGTENTVFAVVVDSRPQLLRLITHESAITVNGSFILEYHLVSLSLSPEMIIACWPEIPHGKETTSVRCQVL
ncbi:UNVERIFIED_CONTAM: hypothetical protein GTU68_038170 [Idotea baltica]|nr:hypothetical protein [Idotea baltica]